GGLTARPPRHRIRRPLFVPGSNWITLTRTLLSTLAGAVLALAISTPALAQGKSQSHKKNGPTPPSRNDLAAPAPVSSSGGGAPLAWLDDASLLDPGGASVGISAMHWSGSGLGE